MRKALIMLVMLIALSSIVVGYKTDQFLGYEDGYLNAEVINGDKILITETTGSLVIKASRLVDGQVVDWFKAKDSRFGTWFHVTVIDGQLNVEPIQPPY